MTAITNEFTARPTKHDYERSQRRSRDVPDSAKPLRRAIDALRAARQVRAWLSGRAEISSERAHVIRGWALRALRSQ